MRTIRNALVKLLCAFIIASVAAYAVAANYQLTQGSGTTFGSLVIGGINYAQHLICDATTPSQCGSVTAGGAQVIDTPASGNLYSAVTAAVPCLNATTATTNSYTTGQTNPANCDLHGNLYASVSALPPTPTGTNLIGKVGIDQTTPGTTNLVALTNTTNAGAATVKGGVGVVNGGSTYQHVAASQTVTLQTSTGAIGDYLSHCVIYPSTTAAGSVTVFDNANAAGTNVIEFVTGTLSNLSPIPIPVGAVSTAGAWKVTTGANETVVCFGKFSMLSFDSRKLA